MSGIRFGTVCIPICLLEITLRSVLKARSGKANGVPIDTNSGATKFSRWQVEVTQGTGLN
jgi:hypothetical protein